MRNNKRFLGYIVIIFITLTAVLYAKDEILKNGTREVMNLNGIWETHKNIGLNFIYPPPKDGWGKEKVPSSQAKFIKYKNLRAVFAEKEKWKDFNKRDDLSSWFRRKFKLPSQKLFEKKAFLVFKGMPYKSDVWLNGEKIGTNLIGLAPKKYNVTKKLKWGEENTLVVGLTGIEGLIDVENNTMKAPTSYTSQQAAIIYDVYMEFVPKIRIENVFIKTSVENKTISAELKVYNSSGETVSISPEIVIAGEWDNRTRFSIKVPQTSIPSNESKLIILRRKWETPVLWSPETPFLYRVACQIYQGDTLLDEKNVIFGFREFLRKGRDFYLNGKPVKLFRMSTIGGWRSGTSEIARALNDSDPQKNGRRDFGMPSNCARIWNQNKRYVELADREGIMVTQSLAFFPPEYFPVEKQKIWLPNLKKMIECFVKEMRNAPSIVIWDITNENYWGKVSKNPAKKRIAKEIVKTIRALDPTRLLDGDGEVAWDGLLDIISIHYPLTTAGDIRQQYPNSGLVIPNDFYWLKDKKNHSWRADFDWDKPLFLGEYWHLGGGINQWISVTGEPIYDWEKWRTQDIRGRDRIAKNPFVEALKMQTDYYRLTGVTGFGPWSGNYEDIMPKVAVRPMDFHPNFYSGEKATRKIAVFNNGKFNYDYLHLQYFLRMNGKIVFSGKKNIYAPSGKSVGTEINIQFPEVTKQQQGELTVRLLYFAAGGFHEKYRYTETVFILPQTSLSDIKKNKIILFDKTGATKNALSKIGLTLKALRTLSTDILKNCTLLIIGKDSQQTPFPEKIINFVKNGGRVLILSQQEKLESSNIFPERDRKHMASKTWKRNYSHPALQEIDDRQLSYWKPDNIVAKFSFIKPSGGACQPLIDSAGIWGLEWTPLCEAPYGKGIFLLSQLNLVNRMGVEPVADLLLSNLIRYGMNFKTIEKYNFKLLNANNKKLEYILKKCNISFTKDLEGKGPVFIDSSAILSDNKLLKINNYLNNGGKVWLHGFNPENIEKVSSLIPFPVKFKKVDKSVKATTRVSSLPIMNSLSSGDFFWTKVNLASRKDFFQNASPTAPIGTYELELPIIEDGDTLLNPHMMIYIPVGKGHILFDTLDWVKAYETEGMKVTRIVTALSQNMGVKITKEKSIFYKYFNVDLSKYANMGYMDEIIDDGKGGWFDAGKADLCYFLINHTGKEGGVAVGVPDFPENVRFEKIPFALIAPKKNNWKSVISLRGKDRRLKLPDKASGIPINKKADTLWFLHTAGWCKKGTKIAEYRIHYADNTESIFPIRVGVEINDWFQPVSAANAKVCWSGRNRESSSVGIFLTEWKNPYPKKEIASIDLTGALSTSQIILLGITGGEKESKSNNLIPVADWHFGNYENGKIPNSRGDGALKLLTKESEAPKKTILDGKPALRLNGKQKFGVNLERLSNYESQKPFQIELELMFLKGCNAKEGKYPGIFQAMHYKKSGFRLVLGPKEKLHLQIFTIAGPLYMKAKTRLEIGQVYHIKFMFDGNFASIYINGNLDGIIKSPFPAPYSEMAYIGQSSGMGYFNGIIRNIKISHIKQDTKATDSEHTSYGFYYDTNL